MGAVFQGYDPALDRTVAIKVLAPHLVWEQEFVERFLREARAAARLRHPNIVTIHDVGQEGGWFYFVMEYLEGQPLSQVRQRRRLTLEDTLRIVTPLAHALDYAHGQGLVHRDVKPANVMVAPDGQVTLTDFGIARAARATRLTRSGVVIGTPDYMSPEQAMGRVVDARSDQYALGVLAYQMLAGRAPFAADNTPALLHQVVYEPPPALGELRPDLPAGVARALERAMAKDPAERYESCGAFAAALEEPPTRGLVPRPAQREAPAAERARAGGGPLPAWVWGLIGTAIVALAVGVSILTAGGGRGLSASTPAPPTEAPTALPTDSPTPAETPTIAPTEAPAPTEPPTEEPTQPPTPAGPRLRDTMTRPADEMVMVAVPAGQFEMGIEGGRSDEGPAHTVALDSFWIDRTEVRVAQFRAFAEATGYQTEAEKAGWAYVWRDGDSQWEQIVGADWLHPQGPESDAADDHPVVQVNWVDVAAYCAWAGARLPTEAEWEYAARGPEARLYPWGEAFDGARLNSCDIICPARLRDTSLDDGYRFTAPVSSFPDGASWCGAHDLAGNVYEWVADWYGAEYYAGSPPENPQGPATGEYRVRRGGSWLNGPDEACGACRDYTRPIPPSKDTGFRCATDA